MTLRIPSENNEIDPSTEEQKAISAENRRVQAEREYLIICDDKKRVLAETEETVHVLKSNKKAIEDTSEEIHKVNASLIEVKNSYRKEVETFDTLVKKNTQTIKDLEQDIKNKTIDKNVIASKIASLYEEHAKIIATHKGDIKDLEQQKKAFIDDIEKCKIEYNDFVSKINVLTQEVVPLRQEIKEINDSKAGLENDIVELHRETDNQAAIIVNNRLIIDGHNILIASKEEEIKALVESKSGKEAEINEKIKNFGLLEQRIDKKMELFREYREKFTVDELSQMKFDTTKP